MRSICINLVLLTFAIFLAPGVGSIGDGQKSGLKVYGCGDFLLHERAMDRVFPWSTLDGQKEGRVVVFRVLPVFSAESQLVIREQNDGRVHVIYSTLVGEKWTHGISEYLVNAGSKSSSAIVDDALSGIQVRDKTIEASQELQNLIKAMPQIRFPENIRNNVMLDADGYEVWVTSGAGELYFKTFDHSSITKWMTEIVRLAKSSQGRETNRSNFPK